MKYREIIYLVKFIQDIVILFSKLEVIHRL